MPSTFLGGSHVGSFGHPCQKTLYSHPRAMVLPAGAPVCLPVSARACYGKRSAFSGDEGAERRDLVLDGNLRLVGFGL